MGRLGRLTRLIGFACLSVLAALPPGLVLAAEEAAKHEEPGIINLNVTLLIQAVNFLILIALLSRFLFTPLRKFLADRAEGIEKALAEAKVAREAAAKAQEEHRAQIVATQREAAALRDQAQREVEAERQRLLKASRDEAQRLVDDNAALRELAGRGANALAGDAAHAELAEALGSLAQGNEASVRLSELSAANGQLRAAIAQLGVAAQGFVALRALRQDVIDSLRAEAESRSFALMGPRAEG